MGWIYKRGFAGVVSMTVSASNFGDWMEFYCVFEWDIM
jgi:hypothetical protein